MPGYIDSYYSRTLSEEKLYPSLEDHIEADVCVIGGGLAGMAVALGLAERGKRAVVLEGRRIGWGASGRNGGFVLAGFPADPRRIARKIGLENAQEIYALTRDALGIIKRRIEEYDIPCNPVDGEIVASWYDDADGLRQEADYLCKNFGEIIDFWPREKVREFLKTGRYHDGLFFSENFHMHPLNYLQGLARAVCEKGGAVYENSMAVKVRDTVGGTYVETEKGSVRAGHVVFCGSAYFNGLEKKLQRSCMRVRTYVIKTEPIDKALLAETIGAPYAIRDDRWADDYYRILPDNSLLWGGRVGIGDAPKNLKALMLKDMKYIYPQLKDVKAEVAWSGQMGYTVHKMPHIGRFHENIWYCTNFGGCGVGPTTAGGEVIASAIAERDERYKLYAPFGFSYTGGPLGPLVAQTVYHGWELRDRFREWKYRNKAG